MSGGRMASRPPLTFTPHHKSAASSHCRYAVKRRYRKMEALFGGTRRHAAIEEQREGASSESMRRKMLFIIPFPPARCECASAVTHSAVLCLQFEDARARIRAEQRRGAATDVCEKRRCCRAGLSPKFAALLDRWQRAVKQTMKR